MNAYERVMNTLGVVARQDLVSAMLLEACLEFTVNELYNVTADIYFKKRFGERLHNVINDIIDHM